MFGTYSKRIVLFVLTNLAVVVLLGIVLRLAGAERILETHGAGFRYEHLLVFAAVFGFAGSLVSLALSKWLARVTTGAEVIDRPRTQDEAWLLETVARQARAAGIGMPEVAIYPSGDPNAFATGMFRNSALVAVSTGLLEGMSPREVEAVLAHEVSHVANGDMVTLALLQGVLNTFVIFLSRIVGAVVDRALSRGDDERGGLGPAYWLTVVVSEILLGLVATVIVLAYSRHREFRADHGSALLEGPGAMIAALERLRRFRDEPAELPPALGAFGVRSGPPSLLGRLFMSHPPLEERIGALRQLQTRRGVLAGQD